MNIKPLYLPGLHLSTLRRTPRSAQQILAEKLDAIRQKTFSQLGACFGALIPSHLLSPTQSGSLSRRRLYSKENTFWAFFSQVLSGDGSCQEVVRKLQSYAALTTRTLPASSTGGYCQARQKLELDELDTLLKQTATRLQERPQSGPLNNRRVVVADGTGLSMPDSQSNQQVWPQQRSQAAGCGFPQASVCACFSLHSGGLLSYALGNKKSHELPLLRQQWATFKPDDIFLGDKGFCSYFDMSAFKDRAVDSVITIARRKPVNQTQALKVLGENDLLIQWLKPKRTGASSYSYEQWQQLPETLTLRQIKVVVAEPGFRGAIFYIATTLLDPERYPAQEIIDLYRQRWEVELYFRDIKTTLGMDILRCKTPSMVRKEIVMHWIVYNCLRWLIQSAADGEPVAAKRLSFKGAIQALRQWEPLLYQALHSPGEQRRLMTLLRSVIAQKELLDRPGRSEPRAVKRRPKNYQRMTAPRHEMVEVGHRGKYGPQPA